MSTFKDHFSGHANQYAKYRPSYPESWFATLAERALEQNLAWDVATGSGQAAVALAKHFQRVYATDASEAQVQQGTPDPRVRYAVEPAERTALEPASVDLVTVAQALHWFDAPRFFEEVRRVLKPGGVWACWCYALAYVSPEVDERLLGFYDGPIGPYWPPERRILERGYRDIEIPLEEWPAPEVAMAVRWNRAEFLGYLGTWSACQRYEKATGVNPLHAFSEEVAEVWPVDEVRDVRFPLAVRWGRRNP